jgi:hypothetical protein
MQARATSQRRTAWIDHGDESAVATSLHDVLREVDTVPLRRPVAADEERGAESRGAPGSVSPWRKCSRR